jgi:hypothetical protein
VTHYPLDEQFAAAEAIHLSEPIDPPQTRSDRMGYSQAQIDSLIAESKRKAARGPVCKTNGFTYEQWFAEVTFGLGTMLGDEKLREMYELDLEPIHADDRVRDYAD